MVAHRVNISTLTEKGQATIPVEVRRQLHLEPGDKIGFDLEEDRVILRRVQPFDYAYHKALSKTLSEWDSSEDDEAYRDL